MAARSIMREKPGAENGTPRSNAAPDDDTRRALQKLLQVLEQPAPR
jgi:hypothetical protein